MDDCCASTSSTMHARNRLLLYIWGLLDDLTSILSIIMQGWSFAIEIMLGVVR